MSININNLNSSTPQVKQKLEQQQIATKQQANQAALKSDQVKHSGQDSVSLTPQAKQLRELQKKANDAPEIDQKKIAKLKKAIMSGEYKIDAEKLAQNMSNFEFSLS
ncbi:MAG: flagellar biosynthesis anti-sigma factor FlgM [Alteromonadaceae bacterium]|nr:flagellar biosynthesis anti-sigma factor FlgM [Alteromonadaceae bacterium]